MQDQIQNLKEKTSNKIEVLEEDVAKLKDQQWKYCSLQIKDYDDLNDPSSLFHWIYAQPLSLSNVVAVRKFCEKNREMSGYHRRR